MARNLHKIATVNLRNLEAALDLVEEMMTERQYPGPTDNLVMLSSEGLYRLLGEVNSDSHVAAEIQTEIDRRAKLADIDYEEYGVAYE